MQFSFRRMAGIVAATAYLLPSQLPAQQSITVYDLTPESDTTVFSVSETWRDTETSATHEVTDIDLSFYLWDDEGDIMDVLTAPNGLTKEEWNWEPFSADFDVVADGRLFRGGWGRCYRWEDDLTSCSMDGDGGTFLIEREIRAEEIRFHLIVRLSPDDIEFNKDSGMNYRPSINVEWPENDYSANMILPSGTEGRVTFSLPLYP